MILNTELWIVNILFCPRPFTIFTNTSTIITNTFTRNMNIATIDFTITRGMNCDLFVHCDYLLKTFLRIGFLGWQRQRWRHFRDSAVNQSFDLFVCQRSVIWSVCLSNRLFQPQRESGVVVRCPISITLHKWKMAFFDKFSQNGGDIGYLDIS